MEAGKEIEIETSVLGETLLVIKIENGGTILLTRGDMADEEIAGRGTLLVAGRVTKLQRYVGL